MTFVEMFIARCTSFADQRWIEALGAIKEPPLLQLSVACTSIRNDVTNLAYKTDRESQELLSREIAGQIRFEKRPCAICFSDMSLMFPDAVTFLECGSENAKHAFCTTCINKWWAANARLDLSRGSASSTCPLCRNTRNVPTSVPPLLTTSSNPNPVDHPVVYSH